MAPLQLVTCRTARIIPTQRIIDGLDAALDTGMEVVIWQSRTPSAELVLRTWAKVHGLYIEDRTASPERAVIVRRGDADGERVASLYLDRDLTEAA